MLSSRRRLPRTRLAVLAVAISAAFALAACGGDDETTTVSAPETTGATTTTAEETTATTTTDTSVSSDVREQFDEALRQNLVETQGLSQAVADCVIDKLHEKLSDEDLNAVASGEVPKKVTDAAFDAGFECASQGG